MMNPYVRPGIDDRPDYDKALSPEDKASVQRLAVDPKQQAPEASADQPGAQAARLAADGTTTVAAASTVDAAVPDYASSFLDMRDPMVSADGHRPSAIEVSRLKWGFAVGSFLITAPWAALNLVAIPDHIARIAGFDTDADWLTIPGMGPGQSMFTLVRDLPLLVVIGALFSIFLGPLVSALSDRTRVPLGRRTPWLVGGGILSALIALIVGAIGNLAGVIFFWILLQFTYVALIVPLAAALSERVPDKFRDVIERWNAIGVIAGQAAGGVIGGLSIAFGAREPFTCAAVLFAISGIATILVWPKEPSSVSQPRVPFDGTAFASLKPLPREDRYRPFRRLFWSRTFMTSAISMTAVFLWYVVRFSVYGSEPMFTSAPLTLPSGLLIAMLALASLAGTLLASYSAGAITDKFAEGFGPWWRDSRAAVVCACALYAVGLAVGLAIVVIGGEKSLMIFSFITGLASGLYDVFIQPLVVDALPDPHDSGRDLGTYALARPLGLIIGALGGALAIAVGSQITGSFSFTAVFPGAIACVAIAALFLRK